MISRRFSAWQKVVALAPLLLLAVYVPGQMMLRCRIDGLLRPACCCPHDSEAQDTGSVIKAQDCCDREVTSTVRPVIAQARSFAIDMSWGMSFAVSAPCVAFSFVQPVRSSRNWQAHGPQREGPGLVLLKHAFLI
jgi:hypothetical protein